MPLFKRATAISFAALTVTGFIAGSSGCSHAPTQSGAEANASGGSPTSVEIHYVLRHSDHKLTIESDAQGVHGKSLIDGSQLKQCQIEGLRYQEFLTKVRAFVEKRRSIASESPAKASTDCRAPYTIVLKNPKDTVQIQGCRMSDEGAFSHLVQDGEFLIYRQK